MYENGTKYNFITNLSKFGMKLGDALQGLNHILYGVVEAKPYLLEWENIIPQCKEYITDGGEIDEFCLNYVLGYSLMNNFSTDPIRKEAMYLHLRAELLAKKAQGEI